MNFTKSVPDFPALQPLRLCALAAMGISVVLLLSACSSTPISTLRSIIDKPMQVIRPTPPITDVRNPDDSLAYRQVEEFFITDRGIDSADKNATSFNADRGDVTYGRALVTIPPNHIKGQLESNSLLPDSQHSSVMLQQPLRKESKDQFFAKLNERIEMSKDKSLFIFVHGYNTTFVDGARVLGQMTHDIEVSGATLMFSWPSQGKVTSYFQDRMALEWAQVHLEQALNDILTKVKTNKVYLVAHSMGNRALVHALLNLKNVPLTSIKEIVLMSPDIDMEVFKNNLGPKLVALNRPITLYVSSKDIALWASRQINEYDRAGDSSHQVLTLPWIETIDVSAVDAGQWGHTYFTESREVMSDLFYLVKNSQRADKRFGLQEVNNEEGHYWRLIR